MGYFYILVIFAQCREQEEDLFVLVRLNSQKKEVTSFCNVAKSIVSNVQESTV